MRLLAWARAGPGSQRGVHSAAFTARRSQLGLQLERALQVAADEVALLARELVALWLHSRAIWLGLGLGLGLGLRLGF